VLARLLPICAGALFSGGAVALELKPDGYHVFPGENIQDAIEWAAKNPTNKTVKVQSGEYRPRAKRQALIWFNREHDGVRVEAAGPVTLTAANEELSTRSSRAFPAVVNHVVYFGDGISSNTILRGFRLTGANGFITDKFLTQIEPDTTIPKNSFFLTDGGAVKIFGRSYPTLESLIIEDNYTSPCGGGISVQHQGHNTNWVTIRDSVFRRNTAQVTGSAIDLLEGSAALILNCLFVANASNLGQDVVAKKSGEPPFVNSGVLTVFSNSRARVENCTFTGNRNAVDDMARGNVYLNSIFYANDLESGLQHERYELDFRHPAEIRGCFINGRLIDPNQAVSAAHNVLSAPDPRFDAEYIPRNPLYKDAGFRPPK
jgi:hypothetical protein